LTSKSGRGDHNTKNKNVYQCIDCSNFSEALSKKFIPAKAKDTGFGRAALRTDPKGKTNLSVNPMLFYEAMSETSIDLFWLLIN
jgi:hypothetical protein